MTSAGGSRRLPVALAAAAILVAVALVGVLAARLGDDAVRVQPAGDASQAREAALPEPVTPAFVPPAPRPLAGQENVARWSPVRRTAAIRSGPGGGEPVIGRLETRTPEGTRNLVLVLARRRDERGTLWVRARLPILENGAVGWVPRAALGGYGAVRTHLVVDRARFRATLFRDGRPVFRAVVGVGRLESPTPAGEFYVRNKLRRYANAFYGPVAFGTSARSATLTDWPAGGFVGIHGTNRPDLLPGRVSHGCIRLRNDDVLALERLMPVGTPLTIL